MKHKYIILLIIIIAVNSAIKAQIPDEPKSLLSPNATALGQYGEVPVSLFTGTPNISIPIYDFSYSEIEFPISINYHSSGIRPDQHPGWVGLGWSLNAGGVISRIVKDLPDEYNNNKRLFYSHASANLKSLANAGYLHKLPLSSEGWHQNLTASAINNDYAEIDTEPDQFVFNFLGLSGRFYIGFDGTIQIECNKPIKITISDEFILPPFSEVSACASYLYGNSQSIKGFTIVDDLGITYTFGYTDSSIEFSKDFFKQNISEWVATSWMLTKVMAPNGEAINIQYERDNFINQMYISLNNTVTSAKAEAWAYNNYQCSSIIGTVSMPYTNIYDNYDCIEGQLISPVYLRKITTPNIELDFERSETKEMRYSDEIYKMKFEKYNSSDPEFLYISYIGDSWKKYDKFMPFLQKWNDFEKKIDPETNILEIPSLNNLKWYQLDKIHIKCLTTQQTLKSFFLKYSDNRNQRLTLNSIVEIGNDNNTKGNAYSFDYYNIDEMPPYLNLMTDHWGYYNKTSSPITNEIFNDNITTRNTNSRVVHYGVLKSIVYPTGGATEFIFEPHEYSGQIRLNRWTGVHYLEENRIGGGIRIKSVVNYPSGLNEPENKTQKRFYYISGFSKNNLENSYSSGILNNQVQYSFSVSTPVYQLSTNLLINKLAYTVVTQTIGSYQSVIPMSENSTGAAVNYTEVTELNDDGSYSINYFSNYNSSTRGDEFVDYLDSAPISQINQSYSFYSPTTSNDIFRGKLLYQEIYDNNNNPVFSKKIEYNAFNSQQIRSLNLKISRLCNVGAFLDGTAYTINMGTILPVKETSIYYEKTGSLTTVKSYYYNQARQLTMEKITNNYHTITNTFKYISDIQNNSNKDYILDIMEMKNLNMLSYPVEIVKNYKGIDGIDRTISGTLFLYKRFDNVNTFRKYAEYKLDIEKPITNMTGINNPQNDIDNRYSIKKQYYRYNALGRPLHFKINSLDYINLWAYNSENLIFESKGCNWENLLTYISEEEIEQLARRGLPSDIEINKLLQIQQNSNLTESIIYTYFPSIGKKSVFLNTGNIIEYNYDLFGRISHIYEKSNNSRQLIKSYNYKTSNY
jgi:hypothetical protein